MPNSNSQLTGSGVSIIILTLNAAPLLKRLLETFFQHNTHAPVELIVVDHGSADDTAAVVAQFSKRVFIRLLRRGQNFSFAASCNYGAAKSRHPYLLFLNNDIVYTEDVLPRAVEVLERDETMGAVGVRLDDIESEASGVRSEEEGVKSEKEEGVKSKEKITGDNAASSLPKGNSSLLTPHSSLSQGIQHLGIEFRWNKTRGYYQPEQIRHTSLKKFLEEISSLLPPHSSLFPAVTGAFMLVRKSDFNALRGFSEEYEYGLEDIDFCLRLGRELKKKCWCIHEVGLQHVEGATRKDLYKTRPEVIEKNHQVFKGKWDGYIRTLLGKPSVPPAPSAAQVTSAPVLRSQPPAPALNVLFVLPGAPDTNNGYQVQLLARMLQSQGAHCTIAIPDKHFQTPAPSSPPPDPHSLTFAPYSSSLFTPPSSLQVIHAWTPREIVREFTEKLLARLGCPLIIHLEDNEEYLTEVTVGKAFADLTRMSEAELDKIIPTIRYHPIRGRKFLAKAQGLTMVIETLNRFNPNGLPCQVIPPIVDERLFYPRPLNRELRKKHNIPDETTVLVYTGNVHAGNMDEVLELYKAVDLLNQQGRPTKLLRTGQDNPKLETSSWPRKHEIHLGWVKREELPEIMAAADMFVQPGVPGPFNDERIPCKLPEFFAMGRPVVLPRTNVGLKVAHGREAYVLDRVNAEGIGGAVQMLWKQPQLALQLSKGAQQYARQHHDIQSASKLARLHARISATPVWLKRTTPQPPASRPVYDLPIVAAACNRPHALKRLLKSLHHAQYHQKVPLIISIDGSADNTEVVEAAEAFDWVHGPMTIRRMERHLGTRQHILACGDMAVAHDGIIILEDDLLVSPVFYSFAQQAFDFFRDDALVAGISLYTHQFNETARWPFVPLTDQSDVFFMQVPSSWGVMWSNAQWTSFRNWQQNAVYPSSAVLGRVPGDVLTWPETSWKKDFFYYVTDSDLFFVYPRVSLTTNFGDLGVHMPQNRVYQVPLRYGDKTYHFMPCRSSLARYDSFCELLPESLNILQPVLAEFDYHVDLYGMKPWTGSPPYTLTVKPVTEAAMTFGREMLPLEANLLHGVAGSEICLAHTSACANDTDHNQMLEKRHRADDLLYHHNIMV